MKEFNRQKRKELKRACKAHVAAHLGPCIGANVLYALPIILLMLIVYVTMFGSSFALLLSGADENAVAQAMLRGTGSGIFTVVLLLIVVSGPLTFGLMRFYTDLSRGGQPGAGAVLQPITSGASLWTGIRMSFCLFLRSLMWTVLPTFLLTIGAIALAMMSYMSGSADGMTGGLIALYVLYGIITFLINIKLLTYNAGWVVLHDNEQYGAWNATRDASAVFRGRFVSLLVFELSFIGWNLLAIAAVYLCVLLGMIGLSIIGGSLGIAILIVSLIAALCVGLVVGSFVNGYYQTSFIAMFDYLATPEPQPMNFDWDPTGASAPTDFGTEAQTDDSSDEPHGEA